MFIGIILYFHLTPSKKTITVMDTDQVAAAIYELAKTIKGQESGLFQSVAFWGIVIPAFIGIITFIITQLIACEKFQHEVSLKCIERFRQVYMGNTKLDETNVSDYLGLINEELYYFRKRLIYPHLADDWLRNLINTLPVFYTEKINDKKVYKVFNQELLENTASFFADKNNWRFLFPFPIIRKTLLIPSRYCQKELKVKSDFIDSYNNLGYNDEVLKRIIREMKCNLHTDKKWKAAIMRLFLSLTV